MPLFGQHHNAKPWDVFGTAINVLALVFVVRVFSMVDRAVGLALVLHSECSESDLLKVFQ